MRTLLLTLLVFGCRTEDKSVNPDDTAPVDDSATVDDLDGDGFDAAVDCDDADANVNPGATEQPYDGLDNDCNPDTPDDDLDGDGFPQADDCDDTDGDVSPDAPELCNGQDDDCNGQVDDSLNSTWYTDADGDGYGDDATATELCEADSQLVARGGDCDDSVSGVSPGAPELCNDRDDDCDGQVDNDPVDPDTWYSDMDSDGFGDPGFPTQACDLPTGYADNDGDCDDGDGDAYPGAQEVCDGDDEDCDGEVDEPGAQGESAWYADSDGDGQGTSLYTRDACDAPSGHVANSDDCDDTDAAVFLGATETCDAADNDCDSAVDEGVGSSWYLDADSDGYGRDGSAVLACDAPTSAYVAQGGDCDDADTAFNPGASPGCDGLDYDCDGSVDNDGDGDGYADISCGGDDCDDSDANVVPEANGGCALGESCLVILNGGNSAGDGVYTIDPDGFGTGVDPQDTYCDMTTDGGGWTLLSKTVNTNLTAAEQDMIRRGTWADYTVDGYGDPAAAERVYWMPLQAWHELTDLYPSNRLHIVESSVSLRMEDFSIGSAAQSYRINWVTNTNGYSQIVTPIKGQAFTTWDQDNDTWSSNCAMDNVGFNGGWWYTNCYQLSMLHSNNTLYSWRNNISTSISSMHVWFREL